MNPDDRAPAGAEQGRWKVLGFDSFEYCSDPYESQPWYEIGTFATETAAIARAWSLLRRWKAGRIEEHIYIEGPDRERRRCVVRYCRECDYLDSLEPTGGKRRAGPFGFFRVKSWEYVCKQCQARDWRERNQVFVLGPVHSGDET